MALFSPALTVSISWVVVEDATGSPVVATQNDEVALVVRGAAEAAVATGSEAAVLDRAGAQVTVQHPRIHQHDGHVALCQVCLDVLHAHCAVGRREVSQWVLVPISQTDVPQFAPTPRCYDLEGSGSPALFPELPVTVRQESGVGRLTISPLAPCRPWLVQTACSPGSPLCRSASYRRTKERRAD